MNTGKDIIVLKIKIIINKRTFRLLLFKKLFIFATH
jgi:hypothetical protein